MRSNLIPLILIGTLGLGGAAFAGTTAASTATTAPIAVATVAAAKDATGTITKINAKGLYIVLSDGHRYHVAKAAELDGLKVGEKVTVQFVMKGRYHDATAIKAA